MGKKDTSSNVFSDYSIKVIKTTGIVLTMILIVVLVLKGFKVLLLALAGILISIFFHGIASILQSKLPLKRTPALIISILLFISVSVGVSFLLYPRVSSQINSLEKELPEAANETKEKIEETQVGQWVIDQTKTITKQSSNGGKQITSFFSSFFGGLGDIYIIFFLGLFFMIQPELYKRGIIVLFPKHKRKRTEEVINTLGYTLKRWLLGKLFSMLIVGILTGIGLAILGIPLALTLAIFAAIVSFIPNFGPIISLIPAFLLAFTKGGDYALYTVLLYAVVQAIESNAITPLIQKKMISFPMAMILLAQVLLGIFTGGLGLILAVPVVAIAMVLIKMLYIEDILGDTSIEVKGEEKFTS